LDINQRNSLPHMSVKLPTTDHLKAALILGLLEGFTYLVGTAVATSYGLFGGFLVVGGFSALLYLAAVAGFQR
jgi:hypothetical protein